MQMRWRPSLDAGDANVEAVLREFAGLIMFSFYLHKLLLIMVLLMRCYFEVSMSGTLNDKYNLNLNYRRATCNV